MNQRQYQVFLIIHSRRYKQAGPRGQDCTQCAWVKSPMSESLFWRQNWLNLYQFVLAASSLRRCKQKLSSKWLSLLAYSNTCHHISLQRLESCPVHTIVSSLRAEDVISLRLRGSLIVLQGPLSKKKLSSIPFTCRSPYSQAPIRRVINYRTDWLFLSSSPPTSLSSQSSIPSSPAVWSGAIDGGGGEHLQRQITSTKKAMRGFFRYLTVSTNSIRERHSPWESLKQLPSPWRWWWGRRTGRRRSRCPRCCSGCCPTTW